MFVGRHFVEAALRRGHDITLFHRGKRGLDLFPGVDRILGDREGGLDAVEDLSYDAIVDTSGYLPRVVRQSVDRFAGSVPKYLFVSTISVYRDGIPHHSDESGDVIELEDPTTEDINQFYGGLKVLCEREVLKGFPDALIVRPGLIAGPHDPTNRFTYWVDRIVKDGEVLVPNRPNQPLQLIDARDLANFMILGLESGLSGTYNTAGPESTFGAMIEACRKLRMDAQLVWASPEFLEKEGISLWQELTLAMPSDDPMMTIDCSKAISAGLQTRSLDDTARDTLAWRRTLPDDVSYHHGLSPEKEAQALTKLKA